MISETDTTLLPILRLARQYAAKSVRIDPEGVSFIDALGREVRPTAGGEPAVVDVVAVLQVMTNGSARHFWDQEVDGVTWVPKGDGSAIIIKPKKPFPAYINSIAPFDEEQLAGLRSLYGRSDIDIVAYVEGDTRARDLGHAIVAEHRLAGLPVRPDITFEERYSPAKYIPPVETLDVDNGGLTVHSYKQQPRYGSEANKAAPPAAPVIVLHSGSSYRPLKTDLSTYDDQGIPRVLIQIQLVKSAPATHIAFSPSALALIDPDKAKLPTQPWNVLAAAAKRRTANRPVREKTWFPTTEAVAEAFVEGKAPRGYVSGNSLFFHGPVAYSGHPNNPCAAFVNDVNGKRVLVLGRTWDGDAVTSMAQSDIWNALSRKGEDFDEVRLDDLRQVIRFAGMAARVIPSHFKRTKDENNYPREAMIDPVPVAAWLVHSEEKARKEIVDAHSTVRHATNRKLESYARVIRLHDLAERMVKLFGLEPFYAVEDIDEMRVRREEARQALTLREEELAARKLEAAAAPSA